MDKCLNFVQKSTDCYRKDHRLGECNELYLSGKCNWIISSHFIKLCCYSRNDEFEWHAFCQKTGSYPTE